MIELEKVNKLISLFTTNKKATQIKSQERYTTLDQIDTDTYENHETTKDLKNYMSSLNPDEIIDLTAIMYAGRKDYNGESFDELRKFSKSNISGNGIDYLLSKKDLDEYLQNGIIKFGIQK